MASILADRTEYFPTLQAKRVYVHAPILIYANNIDEAAGKMLRIAQEEYPGSDGWSVQLSPVTEVKDD